MDTTENSYYVIRNTETGQFYWMDRYNSGWNETGSGFTRDEVVRMASMHQSEGTPIEVFLKTVVTTTDHVVENIDEEIQEHRARNARSRKWQDEIKATYGEKRVTFSMVAYRGLRAATIRDDQGKMVEEILYPEYVQTYERT